MTARQQPWCAGGAVSRLSFNSAMSDIMTIVAPWFGPDTAGGAETQARQLAAA
ncbi:MAG: glycosyl transferase family 1, partial [Roseiflexus castenholzii]